MKCRASAAFDPLAGYRQVTARAAVQSTAASAKSSFSLHSSEVARARDATRLGAGGLPLHSVRTLLDDLATLACNVCYTPLNPNAKIVMTTRPTPVQEEAFHLLNIDPVCTQ
jgi:hypothetical protein